MGFWHNFFQWLKQVIDAINTVSGVVAAIVAIIAFILWLASHFH
jgi:hypothetical protein